MAGNNPKFFNALSLGSIILTNATQLQLVVLDYQLNLKSLLSNTFSNQGNDTKKRAIEISPQQQKLDWSCERWF
jgi:hypothetical protein